MNFTLSIDDSIPYRAAEQYAVKFIERAMGYQGSNFGRSKVVSVDVGLEGITYTVVLYEPHATS